MIVWLIVFGVAIKYKPFLTEAAASVMLRFLQNNNKNKRDHTTENKKSKTEK